MTRRTLLTFAAFIVAFAQMTFAQSLDEARKSYDTGAYQKVIDAAGNSSEPRLIYLVAQSQQKLRKPDDARRTYQKLSSRPDTDAWHFIGQSALDLLATNPDSAVTNANKAVTLGPSIAEAQYQRGLALSTKQQMADAAEAFQKASELDPAWSYPHYYAGIAYSKVKRADLTSTHFQAFLKLAPQAPERAEVQSILRTLGK
jgi:tetratricopeptide (TPR) repeat protein